MGSFSLGKRQIDEWVARHIRKGATALDVGACNGKWWNHLHEWLVMDAVEVWEPNIKEFELEKKYRKVYNTDIVGFVYPQDYDLVIFGDVLEHIEVDKAQAVVEYAKLHADQIIIAVPYLYPQDAVHGNPYEVHKQDDLTHEIFMERYPGFKRLLAFENYAYYIREGGR